MAESAFREKLERVLIRHIPGCESVRSATRLSGGASQETYRIEAQCDGGQRVFALRRAVGGTYNEPDASRPGLRGEAELMRQARANGVPAPEVFYVLNREDGLGDGFVMEWVEGEALGARIVRRPEYAELRGRLAYEIGKVLARVHRIDVTQPVLEKHLAETPPEEFIAQTWGRYVELGDPVPMIDYVGRWLTENLRSDNDLVLVHNDFRTGNFMVSTEEIVAVIDWEAAHIGDPMRDLGWICVNSWRFGGELPVGGFGTYEDLLRGYEEVSGRKVDVAEVEYWQVFGSFWWAVTCLGMVALFRNGKDASIERASIGRRTSEALIDCVNLIMPGPVDLIEPTPSPDLDQPRADELLGALSRFLRDDVMSETEGRTNFLARVSANSIDILAREQTLLAEHRRREKDGLRKLLGSDEGDLRSLRQRLSEGLRDGSISLANEDLVAHLRNQVANQLAIDQPRYSGYKEALEQNN